MHGDEVALVDSAVGASGLLAPGAKILVMLSGGRDSTCLLDVAARLRGAQTLHAIHVNYGLRGAESERDEEHCAALCERLGVPLERVRAERVEGGGGNLQAWAREQRYEQAMQHAARIDAERAAADKADCPPTQVAAGHTATDQVETILYRLAASPGRRALLGMPARDDRLVRPLLAVTREQTAAYCRARGLAWREDSSNDSELYARVRVRSGLLRALREVHPAAEANVLRTAALLREETALLDALVAQELGGTEEIEVERLATLPAALQRLIVIRLAERASGAFVPQAGERVAELIALGREQGRGRAELHVGGLACAVLERGVLRMRRLSPRA
jgi:tRNA(Ile)-lysidine synthase